VVDELADDTLKRLYRQRRIAIGVGAFAVILALVAPFVAIALYLILAVLFLVLPLLGMHRRDVLRCDRLDRRMDLTSQV